MASELVPHTTAEQAHQQFVHVHAADYRPWKPYAVACLPSREWQQCKLEALRYKWTSQTVTHRWMQRLGDFGRQYFPYLHGRYHGDARGPV